MPSVIHMLGLAVVAAVTVGTLVVYYALNGGEQLYYEDARQRRRRSDPQLFVQERPVEANLQSNRDPDNPCGICDLNIQDTEFDLTSLPCSHNFHCRCICDHLRRTATNDLRQSTCPLCEVPYTLENIFEPRS